MSKRDWKLLFEDILDAIDKIEKYTENIDFKDFFESTLISDAVVRNIEIIGEASKNVPPEIQDRCSVIPWKKLSGIRNRIVHEYFGVDLNIIWHIIKNELTSLKSQISSELESDQDEDSPLTE